MPVVEKICRFVDVWTEDHLSDEYIDESKQYEFKELSHKLSAAVQEENIDAYRRLLLSPCTFKKERKVKTDYKGNHHTRFEAIDTCYTRPLLEYLFFEENDRFLRVVQHTTKLLPEFQRVFIEKLNETDLKGIADFLTKEKGSQIIKRVSSLETYGKRLGEKDGKGRAAVSLANTLQQDLEKFVASDYTEISPQNNLQCLIAKISFIIKLHSKDDIFVRHQGYKMIIANIATVVFTAGLANLILGCCTGGNRWVFFNKTTTQGLIDKLDSSVKSHSDFVTLSLPTIKL